MLLCLLLALIPPLQAQTPPESTAPMPPVQAQNAPAQAAVLDPEALPTAESEASPPLPLESPAAATEVDDLPAFLDGLVEGLRREHLLPGVTVAVVRADAPDLLRGYGHADLAQGSPVDPQQTLFRIGSVSKTFIWTAALLLVDRGQLDLDADVNGYLKAVQVTPAFDAPVTMRQLMAHRAGFEDSLQLFAVGDDDARPLAQLLAEHQPQRVYPPGARTSYSNWGSALAAQVVADIAGEDYGSFLRRELLDPLGMRDTVWDGPTRMDPSTRARLAQGYAEDGGVLRAEAEMQLGAYWPAGGISTTAADMARWMRFHLNKGELDGRRLLTENTHRLIWTRPFDDRSGGADLSHGFIQTPLHGLLLTGHGGATESYLSNLVLVPELGLGVFVSQSSSASRNLVQRLPEHIIERTQALPAAAPLASDTGEPGALAEINGNYLGNRRVFSSFATVFGAFDGVSLQAVNSETLALNAGPNSGEYRRIGEDLFESAQGQRLSLIRDGSGSVTAFANGSGVHTFERVSGLHAPQALHLALGVSALLALALLAGALWRVGRKRIGGPTDAVVGGTALLSALCVLVLIACMIAVALALQSTGAADLPGNYPVPAMLWTHWAGWAVVASALLLLLMLMPAWTRTRFSVWRKLMFTLFTLALSFLAMQLWIWRVIGAAVV
jgi:CubicO group peptidase (beta-lactamase class C family)